MDPANNAATAAVKRLQSLPPDPRLALIFPGQGSQKPGMGRDACAASAAAREVFALADATLGRPLSRLCFEGPEDELTLTSNAQPAILATSVAILAAALESGALASRPAFVAGHSLGQFTALVAAGSLAFSEAIQLVQERGRLMAKAGEETTGTMAAIVGLDAGTVEAICAESGAEPANYNGPTQVVVGGTPDAVARASALAKERGGRGLPVNVSGAFHTSLMESAAAAFARVLASTGAADPQIPVISNVSALPLTSGAAVTQDLARQVRSAVRWHQSTEYMVAHGVTRFIEVGPGRLLTGQLKRSLPGVETENMEGVTGLASSANV